MSGYGSQTYNVGPEGGESVFWKPITPDPTQEYIATGPGRFTPQIPQAITSEFDDISRSFGFQVFEAMLTDPAVASSFLSLKLSILAGDLKVQPTVSPKGYRQGQSHNVDAGKGKTTPKEGRAIEISEFCQREMCRNHTVSFKSVLNQLLDKMVYGVKLAEKTREEVEYGPDKGKLGLKSISIKPHWAWKFVVDSTMKPQYILTWLPPQTKVAPDPAGYALIPISKFIHACWLPKDGDPRGTSALRPAYDWWNLKRQCMPFYYQHLRRFGSPSLDGMTAQGDTSMRYQIDPNTGLEVTSLPKVDAIQRYTQALIAFQNNSVLVRPFGSEFNIVEPNGDGEAFLKAFDFFDRAICTGICLQSRGSMEAKHGSKADSDTSQDTRALVTDYGKEELGEEISNQLFYESVLLNFGPDDAEEFTPKLLVGKTEQQDKAAMWTAASSAGWSLGPSQLAETDVMIGAPERDEEADAQAATDAAQQAADMMVASKPPSPGGPGSPPRKTPAKPKGK